MTTGEKEKSKNIEKSFQINTRKWGKETIDSGWTLVPNVLIQYQAKLGLDPIDLNIIIHLLSYWWTPENKPHPTKKTISEALNVTPRTVQRRIQELEKCGFIRREARKSTDGGNKSNLYHLDGLIEAIKPIAKQKLEIAKNRKIEDEEKRTVRRKKATT